MKSIAIHQKDDWFMVNLPGYGDIEKGKIEIEINLAANEYITNDYKALRGAMIMERYFEKREREIKPELNSALLTRFDEKFNTSAIRTLSDLLKNI